VKFLKGILAAIFGIIGIFTIGKKASAAKTEKVKEIEDEISEVEEKIEEKVEENEEIREDIKEKEEELETLKEVRDNPPEEPEEAGDAIYERLKNRGKK